VFQSTLPRGERQYSLHMLRLVGSTVQYREFFINNYLIVFEP